MTNWLNADLKLEIRNVFEPRYKRLLTEEEVEEIGENLEVIVEEILRLKWRKKYEYTISRS